ncbi:MAG TPA: MarR family transcriptional regulator, partial [Terricaulis sp.]|nr:MarR family transcriptional regulator [Terricaulis sp.]
PNLYRAWSDRERAQAVRLTEAGEAMLQSSAVHARAADAAILDALPRAKRKTFLSLLTKLSDYAAEAAEKAARAAKRDAKRKAKARKKKRGAAEPAA